MGTYLRREGRGRWAAFCLTLLLAWQVQAVLGWAQAPLRKIGEMDLAVFGIAATVDPTNPVVPKNIGAGVRIVLKAGPNELSSGDIFSFLGGPYRIEGEYAGPGLAETLTLIEQIDAPSNELPILRLPPVPIAGTYDLRNLRLTRRNNDGSVSTILDVTPSYVPVTVIEQVLITSVQTRPLTMQEIRDKGILLDGDDYLGFQFSLGLKLESKVVKLDFPVVFDRQDIRPPQIGKATTDVPLDTVQYQVPQIVPLMLATDGAASAGERLQLENGQSIDLKIPGLLVIPGDVGYLNQMFSAQLFVANGAPVGAPLTVRDVTGTIVLPEGADRVAGTNDDPLVLMDLVTGPQLATQPVVQIGPDGQPGTADDVPSLRPAEQGQAEFLLSGRKEGFHNFKVNISATLDGLITGPTTVKGVANGGVLVRNPYFNLTFTVPTVVRTGEPFSMFVTINNIGQGVANAVSVTIDEDPLSGVELESDAVQHIETIPAGDARTIEYKFTSLKTGAVVAHYLRLDGEPGHDGNIRFKLGVGERGVPLSPDTLALPTVVSRVPTKVVNAAMRVLGQAWSVANAPSGTLPPGVLRISKNVATERALLLAETGLRITLDQPEAEALRDFATDFYGGATFDAAFDQLLRTTIAGHDLNHALGEALDAKTDLSTLYSGLTDVMTAGPDAAAIALTTSSGQLVDAVVVDVSGKRSSADHAVALPESQVAGTSFFPLSESGNETLGLLTSFSGSPFQLQFTGRATGSLTLSLAYPSQGSVRLATVSGVSVTPTWRGRITIDPTSMGDLALHEDHDGDGLAESTRTIGTSVAAPTGPRLISASVIGPETLTDAAPFGFHTALLFDRRLDPVEARDVLHYQIPNNGVQMASRQLSGRLVFAVLKAPEGPNVPTTMSVSGMRDMRGVQGTSSGPVTMTSRLQDPGAVVVGRVMQADATPVMGVPVYYSVNPDWRTCDPKYGYSTLAAVPVDASGQFELRYVRKDNCGMPFTLTTQDPVFGTVRTVSAHVRGAGDRMSLDLVLLGRGSVTGFVLDQNNQPIPGANVVAVSQTDPQSGGVAKTDGYGRYTINDIIVGNIAVKAGKGTEVGSGAGVIRRAGLTERVDVYLDRGTVTASGTVTRVNLDQTTEPIVGVTVVFDTEAQGNLVAAAVATTDKDGKFTFDKMPSGAYRVRALISASQTASASGVAVPGDTIFHALLVNGNAVGRISGRVVMPVNGGEQPAPNVYVFYDQRFAETNAQGEFVIENIPLVPNAERTLTAMTRDGSRRAQSTLRVDATNRDITNVKLTLSGLGTAEFTLVDALGNVVRNQAVRLIRPDAGCGLTLATATTNNDGVVRFLNQPVGNAYGHVLIRTSGYTDVATATARIATDGGTGSAVMRLVGVGIVSGVVKERLANGTLGDPVYGAELTISSKRFDPLSCTLLPGESHHVRSAENGTFRIPNVNLGPVTISAHQDFLSAASASGVLTTPGQDLTFTLGLANTMAGELTGIVKLPDNETIAGAGVEVTLTGQLPDAMVKTNAEGRYRFAKLFPEGHYTITARDPLTGGAVRDRVFLQKNQDATQDLTLLGRGTVVVKVRDANDAPVTQALVKLQEKDFPGNSYDAVLDPSTQDPSNPDSLGVVTFPNVFQGEVSVEVVDGVGRGGRVSGSVPAPDTTVELTLRVGMTGVVTGKFVKPDGETAIPFGNIVLTKDGRTIGQATAGGAGPDTGTFRFDYVPAGNIRIDASDPDSGRTGVAVGRIDSEGQIVDLLVRAQALGTVTGVVTLNGSAQPFANVLVAAGSLRANATTDTAGRYVVTGVPEGLVKVTASFDNQFLQGAATGSIAADDATVEINVALRGVGDVSGRVTTHDGNAPPLTVVTLRAGGVGGGTMQATTDAAGDFNFARVPVGLATLAADVVSNDDSGSSSVPVTEGNSSTANITLNGLGRLSGLTRDNQNNPIGGYLTVTGTGAVPFSITRQTDASGAFAFYDLPAGTFTLQFRALIGQLQQYGTAAGIIPASGQIALDVSLQPSGGVSGTVLRSTGAAALGAEVTISVPSRNLTVKTEATGGGAFTVIGLPLEAIVIRVYDQGTGGVALVKGHTIDTNGGILPVGSITLDDTPISVVGVTPAGTDVSVPRTTPVTIVFSDPIEASTAQSIQVKNGTATVSTSPQVSADGLTVTITRQWPDPADLTVVVPVTIRDIYGRHPAQAFTSTFRTSDATAPEVTSVSPAQSSSRIAALTPIVVTFSEPLDSAALAGVISVTRAGNAIAGNLTLDATGTVLTFTAADPAGLPLNSVVTYTVAGAKDPSGNVQAGSRVTTFRTLDTVPPAITFVSPAPGGITNQARPVIEVHFSDTGEVASGVDVGTAKLYLNGEEKQPTRLINAISYQPADRLQDETSYTVTVTVKDGAGNEATASNTFTVKLPPTGSITGVVLVPGGAAPSVGTAVAARMFGNVMGTATTDANGAFTIENLPLSTFTIEAKNAAGLVRAESIGLQLTLKGQVLDAPPLTLLSEGRIAGTVTGPSGNPEAGASVRVRSLHYRFGVLHPAVTTGVDGTYAVDGVLEGAVSVEATASPNLRGTASGTILRDDEVTVNVTLFAPTPVTFPLRLRDGNNVEHQITRGGLLNDELGALDIMSGGTATRFTGAMDARVEDDNRELVVRQANMAGLQVTRKIFVPKDGYFVRYLETLENPGGAPITVGVRLTDTLNNDLRVRATSSGDDVLDVTGATAAERDRWVVMSSASWWDTTSHGAFVFDGEPKGAVTPALRVTEASLTVPSGGRVLQSAWQNVEIGSGQTVTLMHFVAKPGSIASAAAAAARLTQVPGEALAGLDVAERLAIRNFVVPEEGPGDAPALPALDGTIGGFVLAHDGTTPVPFAYVTFRSLNPYYPAPHTVRADANGEFQIATELSTNLTRLVPIGPFTLTAEHPSTFVFSAEVPGDFAPQQSTALQNVVMTSTGSIAGVVYDEFGVALPEAQVSIWWTTPGGQPLERSTITDDQGAYRFTGLEPLAYSMRARQLHNQGTALDLYSDPDEVVVTASGQTTRHFTFPPTARITGIVKNADGSLAVDMPVTVAPCGFCSPLRTTRTDAAGSYTLTGIPPDTYVLWAGTYSQAAPQMTITPPVSTETPYDLTFTSTGTVRVTVRYPNNAPVPFQAVYLRTGGRRDYIGSTDASGVVVKTGVNLGSYFALAEYPNRYPFSAETPVQLTQAGEMVDAAITMALGSLSGRVLFPDGSPAASTWVSAAVSTFEPQTSVSTNAAGEYSFPYIWLNRQITLTASVNGAVGTATTTVTPESTTPVDIHLSALATVRVRVKRGDDAPMTGVPVALAHPYWGELGGTTDQDGYAIFENLPEGQFSVRVVRGLGTASGTIAAANHGTTIDVTIVETGLSRLTATITAGDGVTLLPPYSATARVTDPATQEEFASVYLDETGVIDALVPAGRALVLSIEGAFFATPLTRAVPAIAADDTATIAWTLPLAVVTGHVTFADGTTPVAYPTVMLTGATLTVGANTADENGAYFALTPDTGEVIITAQDSSSGLTGTATITIPGFTQAVVGDVSLQPSGTITGVVRDAGGAAVSGARVAVASASSGFVRESETGGDGTYTLTGVRMGELTIQAASGTRRASAIGVLSVATTSIALDLQFPQTGRVQGQVFGVDGLAVSGATVIVQSQAPGPIGTEPIQTTTNGEGRYVVDGIDRGDVTVSAELPDAYYGVRGVASGALGGTPLTLDIHDANAVRTSIWEGWIITDPDRMLFDVVCSGDVGHGGILQSEWTENWFSYAASLRLYGSTFPCAPAIRVLHEGRTAAVGPAHVAGLIVSRETYVPDAGGFIRYLETLSNPTAQPITLDVVVRSDPSTESTFIEMPAATNHAYAAGNRVGVVAAGPTGGLRPRIEWTEGDDIAITWRVTVAPGQTVSLLHFLVQSRNGNAGTRAQALSALTNPAEALDRLTPQQLGTIVNFVVP